MQQLRARELAAWLADTGRKPPILLDVREDWEVARCCLPGITHVPMQEVPARAGDFDPAADLVVICHHGVRSLQVASYLEDRGFSALYNLTGGVAAWADEVDAAMPRY